MLATLETFPSPTSVTALRELSVKMYGTHRSKNDASEVFLGQNAENSDGNSESEEEETIKVTNGEEKVFLMGVKKATKSRNNPGQAETSKRGAIANFQWVPSGIQRPRVCIRCGDPSLFVKDCPRPYRAVMGPRFSTTFVKKTPDVTHMANDLPESCDSKPEEKESAADPEKADGNPITPAEQQAENDLYKLWEDFIEVNIPAKLARFAWKAVIMLKLDQT